VALTSAETRPVGGFPVKPTEVVPAAVRISPAIGVSVRFVTLTASANEVALQSIDGFVMLNQSVSSFAKLPVVFTRTTKVLVSETAGGNGIVVAGVLNITLVLSFAYGTLDKIGPSMAASYLPSQSSSRATLTFNISLSLAVSFSATQNEYSSISRLSSAWVFVQTLMPLISH